MDLQDDLTRLLGPAASEIVPLALLLGASLAAYGVARWWLVAAVGRLVQRSETSWDDALVEHQVFVRLAHVAPAYVVHHWIGTIDGLPEGLVYFVQRVALAVMVIVVAVTLSSLLTAINTVYSSNPEYRHRPIKGYLQVLKLVLYSAAAVSAVSILLDRSPLIFLSGLGAMTAVLLLIFKDTILSLVASVQIASNDMIHVGDWVEMPQCGADGDVIDIALHTVKIQNWDKTITTVPTYRFINEGFKNWRGMSRSGGRRIKRAVHLDVSSIRFLSEEEVDRFGRWGLLRDYIKEKKQELAEYNARVQEAGRGEGGVEAGAVIADLRLLTNVGTFRAYVFNYLKQHPMIHDQGFTLLVRQLSPGPNGLPIELYCFSNDQDWARYEGIQSDIFDHVLAILPEFGLRAFQSPTGHDLAALNERIGAGHD
jgi:miniconductance mechanosensitive channel